MISPVLPFPEMSTAVLPDLASNPYPATRPAAGGDGSRHVVTYLVLGEGAFVDPHFVDQPTEVLAVGEVAADPQRVLRRLDRAGGGAARDLPTVHVQPQPEHRRRSPPRLTNGPPAPGGWRWPVEWCRRTFRRPEAPAARLPLRHHAREQHERAQQDRRGRRRPAPRRPLGDLAPGHGEGQPPRAGTRGCRRCRSRGRPTVTVRPGRARPPTRRCRSRRRAEARWK